MEEFTLLLPQAITEILKSLRFFHPEICLGIAFLTLIILDLFIKKKQLNIWLFAASLLFTAYFCFLQYDFVDVPIKLFNNSLLLDKLAVTLKLILLTVVFLGFFFFVSDKKIKQHRKGINDLLSILAALTLGLFLMVSSANFLILYLSIEMVSIGSYLLVGYLGLTPHQTEATLKYALFGAVSSAIMLYGISVLYALTGSISFLNAEILVNLASQNNMVAVIAIIMIFTGIGFKLTFVPMHFWVPDVYEGAATSVTSFLSTAPKIAGFGLLIKLLLTFTLSTGSTSLYWPGFNFMYFFAGLSVASLLVGNFGATLQNNIKRMLAYAAIGHTGFMLMLFVIAGNSIYKSLIFYLIAYAIANIGAFMAVNYIEERSGKIKINEYSGLGKKLPLVSICFTIIIISLIGIPVSAGFFAKVFIFSTLIDAYSASNNWVFILMMVTASITTVVSLFYYFKIPLYLFLKPLEKDVDLNSADHKQPIIILLCSVFVTIIGLFPQIISFIL